jgi:hypothetical protein
LDVRGTCLSEDFHQPDQSHRDSFDFLAAHGIRLIDVLFLAPIVA